jgi:hypothetical protein
MTRFASNYPVGRSTRTCAATGRALAEGERCIAALVENDREQLERLDFSTDAWQAGARPTGPGLRLIGFWRTTATAAERHRGPVLDEESLLELLTGIEPGEPRRDALRLVLALLLLRKRALVQEGHKPGKLLVRPRSTPKPPEGPPLIEINDTGLNEAAINDVMSELEPLIGLGPSSPAAPDSSGGA